LSFKITNVVERTIEISKYVGWQVIQHGGLWIPYYSQISILPGLNLGIFTTASSLGAVNEYFVSQDLLHVKIVDVLEGG
jgi:hypothetical protein